MDMNIPAKPAPKDSVKLISGNTPSVFISHSTHDQPFIEREILPFLHDLGVQTWYSKVDIPLAGEWQPKIVEGLERSDWFLVVISAHALASKWVQREVLWAMDQRPGRVLPVLLDDAVPYRLPLGLFGLELADFRGDRDEARRRIAAVL